MILSLPSFFPLCDALPNKCCLLMIIARTQMRKTWISSISSFSKIVCYRIIINNLIKFLCQLEDTEKNPKKPKKKKGRGNHLQFLSYFWELHKVRRRSHPVLYNPPPTALPCHKDENGHLSLVSYRD